MVTLPHSQADGITMGKVSSSEAHQEAQRLLAPKQEMTHNVHRKSSVLNSTSENTLVGQTILL